jgi:hypothetical protein
MSDRVGSIIDTPRVNALELSNNLNRAGHESTLAQPKWVMDQAGLTQRID